MKYLVHNMVSIAERSFHTDNIIGPDLLELKILLQLSDDLMERS